MDSRFAAFVILFTTLIAPTYALCQQKPETEIELKAYGAAPDLFTDQSDTKYQKRGFLNLFWLSPDRLAVAFSTTHRWDPKPDPEPLQIRLTIFDRSGNRQASRDWDFPALGPGQDSVLRIVPGPEGTILAVQDSISDTRIPDGNFLQVLKSDTTLQQNFYIPATSTYISGWPSDLSLITQQSFTDKHSELSWFAGQPLKSTVKLTLPKGVPNFLAGPQRAAFSVCDAPNSCTGIRLVTPERTTWCFANRDRRKLPMPRAFLPKSDLLVELREPDDSSSEARTVGLLIAHPDGSATPLPDLPKGQSIAAVTGISADGQRFSIDTTGTKGLCGDFNFFCKPESKTFVIDTAKKQIVLERTLSGESAESALSPDGKHIAILEKNRILILPTPSQ